MESKSNISGGKRLADEGIYLNEDRYEKPKELFKFIADILGGDEKMEGTLLDVGCATGELVYYLKNKRFGGLSYTGIDISQKMIEQAEANIPGARFLVQSILDEQFFREEKFDYVICSGVLSIFDDLEPPLLNLLSCTKPGGKVIIHTNFNEHPIDMLMRYKPSLDNLTVVPKGQPKNLRTKGSQVEWQTGWNIFSKATYENILSNSGRELSVEWHDFRMPFDIPETDDPMRCWTIKTEKNPHQEINGACQILDKKVLEIKMGASPESQKE